MPATDDDTLLPFSLPNICKKKVTAAFDGGTISSDGGVFLLADADERLGLIDALAELFPDRRDPAQISHSIADILRERVFAIACGYPDGNDLDAVRADPAFKMACGRLPASGTNLASQPTLSRLENTPGLRALIRLSHGMIDLWYRRYPGAPKSVMLDIDDTADKVHGHQQRSLFHAHYDERCFLPIHVYDADTGHCVLTILRPGKTPDGEEIRGHIRCPARRSRMHWPATRITFRGDSHYGRKEVMDWCEQNDVTYILGLAPNKVLAEQVFPKLDECCARRALDQAEKVRDVTVTRYAARSWSRARRVVAGVEVTRKGADIRYIVTNNKRGTARHLQEKVYCARSGGEPDQTAQRPVGLGPDPLPLASRQSDAADLAHSRLSAGANDPGRHTPARDSVRSGFLQHSAAIVEDRSAGPGDRKPDQIGLRRELPAGTTVPGLIGSLFPRLT